ncbi:50S ribosomal protein L25 [Buchnera aphidicola (Periphyllus testudinaceus)]|uniref:50S ribosomal protein L25 n=1 Tax=Buchnera aphidicola TaxID=9 RepID=UPI0034646D93
MITIYGTERLKSGTSYSRQLRCENSLPSIVYGKKKKNLLIKLKQNDIINFFNKNKLQSNILLVINKKKIKVILKEVQRHPYKHKFLHIDFLRI